MGSGTTGRPRASPYGEHLQPIWAPVVRLTLMPLGFKVDPILGCHWASKSTPSSRSIVGPITGAPWTLALQPWKSHSRAASSPTTCARSWRTRWLRQSRRCDRCWSKSVKSGALLGSQARCLEAAGGVAAEGVAAEEGAGVGGEEEGAGPEGGAAAATLLAGGRAGHACTCSGEWRAGRVGLGQLFDACQDGEHWHVLQVA